MKRLLLIAALIGSQAAHAKAPLVFSGTDAKLLVPGSVLDSSGNAIVPDQTSQTDEVVVSDGTSASYAKIVNANISDTAGIAVSKIAGGAGELNLIDNSSDATNWTETGTRFNGDPVTTTTAGDLPLAGIIDSAIQIVSDTTVAGNETTDFISYAFTTPATLASKLKVEFYMRPGSNFVASEWTVSVWDTAGPTRQTLSTDSSSLTYLPNATGKFTTTFDAVASTSYTLRFTRRVAGAASAATLNIANVIVGPGIQPQGAVVGPEIAFTPTFGGITTCTLGKFTWQRIGSTMRIRGSCNVTAFSGTLSLTIPNSLTIDTTNLQSSNLMDQLGIARVYDDSATTFFLGNVVYQSSTTLRVVATTGGSGTWSTAFPITWASADDFIIDCTVPIAEWAGSGTVNVAQNDVEYAYNSSATTANDSTSFGYGPDGVLFQSFAPAATSYVQKRVRFQTPIQATDSLELEVLGSGLSTWTRLTDRFVGYHTNDAGTAYYGAKVLGVSGVSTDVDVLFFSKVEAVNAWSAVNTFKWRVKKVSGGQAVGFGLATTEGVAGLVNPYSTNGVVYSGTYTPTLTAAANCSALVLNGAQYQRVGNIVTVTAQGTLTVTTTATDTSFTMTLPVATANFSSAYQANGLGILVKSSTNIRDTSWVRATSGAATVEVFTEGTGIGSATGAAWYASFSYEIQ